MSRSSIVSMKAMSFSLSGVQQRKVFSNGRGSAAVVADLCVFAVIGVVAGRAPRAKLLPENLPVVGRIALVDGRRQRRVRSAVGWVEEKRRAETLGIDGDETAMQRGPVPIVRPNLNDVADVDDERVAARLDELPRTVVQHLETGLLVLEQERQRAGICVVVDAEEAVLRHHRLRGPLGPRAARVVV